MNGEFIALGMKLFLSILLFKVKVIRFFVGEISCRVRAFTTQAAVKITIYFDFVISIFKF